jgi:hypothetical protein
MPSDNDMDYRQFTRAELLEALTNIDALQFPQNHQRLIAEIAARERDVRPETPSKKPERISRLAELRGEVTGSIGTKVIYGALGAFYLCLPLVIIGACHGAVQIVWAVVATAMIWVIAAFQLFGFCVTYRFEAGVVSCLLFGRHILWKDRLGMLQDVKSDFIQGLPTIYFVWPDHRRRLWLRVSDLDSVSDLNREGA